MKNILVGLGVVVFLGAIVVVLFSSQGAEVQGKWCTKYVFQERCVVEFQFVHPNDIRKEGKFGEYKKQFEAYTKALVEESGVVMDFTTEELQRANPVVIVTISQKKVQITGKEKPDVWRVPRKGPDEDFMGEVAQNFKQNLILAAKPEVKV